MELNIKTSKRSIRRAWYERRKAQVYKKAVEDYEEMVNRFYTYTTQYRISWEDFVANRDEEIQKRYQGWIHSDGRYINGGCSKPHCGMCCNAVQPPRAQDLRNQEKAKYEIWELEHGEYEDFE